MAAQAQPPLHNSAAAGSLTASPYAITSSGPHQNVWTQVTILTNADGSVTPFTHSYTQIATGLNHLVNGQWVASSENIQITPDGNGAATNTQHQVYFAPNINSSGSIDLIKPDGQHLTATVLGLSLYDTSTGSNAIIAQLQDSIGQILQTSNQVIYTNALADSGTDFEADVLYTQKRSGLEQDIVLHQQPPAPGSFGLNPETTMLQVWTQFVQAPEPEISTNQVAVQVWSGGQRTRQMLPSETLKFGSMRMDQGSAFMSQASTNSSQTTNQSLNGLLLVPVAKQWVRRNGQKFLVEEIPLNSLATQLNALPQSSASTNSQANARKRPSFFQEVSAVPGKSKSQRISMARAKKDSRPALVMDYTLNNGSFTNFTFQSDTTYLIGSGNVNLYGMTTIEGGTVIKYTNAPDNTPNMNVYGGVTCLTAPYRPAFFTSQDDDTLGSAIPGSTGTPGLLLGTYLYWTEGGTISNLSFSYGFNGFSGGAADDEIWDCKFIKCSHPITANPSTINLGLHNVLITMDPSINQGQEWAADVAITEYSTGLNLYGEHVTVDVGNWDFMDFYSRDVSAVSLTNSIIQSANLLNCWDCDNQNDPSEITYSTNSVYYTATPAGTVFQTNGAGYYYLAPNSPCRGVGTTNLSPGIIADIQSKTTWPPIVLSNTFTQPITLSAEVQRDTSATPDLGYHYPPLDFFSSYCLVSNTTLMLTNGVVVAYFNDTGFGLTNAASLVSQGTPNQPDILTFYRMVQEQATNLWAGTTASAAVQNSMPLRSLNNSAPNANSFSMRFTTVSGANGASTLFYSGDYSQTVSNFYMRDCEIYAAGAQWYMVYASITPVVYFENNLVHRAYYFAAGCNVPMTFYNNLFYRPSTYGDIEIFNYNLAYYGTGTSSNITMNNAFDNCWVYLDGQYTNNAYLNGVNWECTPETGAITTAMTWATGALGRFYQASGSPLINMGNTNANYLGLYHYTTQTNEVPEADSIVDIGYHYVALGTNGLPLDTNGDGIPDYLEDANGNGIADGTEINWLINPYNGLTLSSGLSVFTPLK